MDFRLGDSRDELAHDFRKAVKFSDYDVSMNRQNKISPAQLLRLSMQAMRPFYTAVGALLGWLLFVHVVRLFLPGILGRLFWGKSIGGGAILLIGCTWAVIIGFFHSTRLTGLLLIDMLKQELASVEGRVSTGWAEVDSQGLDKFHGEKTTAYSFMVKGKEFEVNERAYQLVHSNYESMRPSVRIYYTLRSQLLLSIEPM